MQNWTVEIRARINRWKKLGPSAAPSPHYWQMHLTLIQRVFWCLKSVDNAPRNTHWPALEVLMRTWDKTLKKRMAYFLAVNQNLMRKVSLLHQTLHGTVTTLRCWRKDLLSEVRKEKVVLSVLVWVIHLGRGHSCLSSSGEGLRNMQRKWKLRKNSYKTKCWELYLKRHQ